MKRMARVTTTVCVLAGLLAGGRSFGSQAMLVGADNFARAESDLYFGNIVKDGGFGKFSHNREVTPIDKQMVIRQNRDTLYSAAVFDLDAGPVTIGLPDAGKRFMSMQVISEDHYCPGVYYGGIHTLTREQIGSRYVAVAIPTLVDPSDPKDLDEVHALQDAIEVSQSKAGSFEIPPWDPASQKKAADGSVTVQFGGCDGAVDNCLPIVPGWNYIVRLYRPRAAILDGTWKFPDAQPVG